MTLQAGGFAVETVGLAKRFGSLEVVRGVDPYVPRGSAFGSPVRWALAKGPRAEVSPPAAQALRLSCAQLAWTMVIDLCRGDLVSR